MSLHGPAIWTGSMNYLKWPAKDFSESLAPSYLDHLHRAGFVVRDAGDS
jgi:hypothetical protein